MSCCVAPVWNLTPSKPVAMLYCDGGAGSCVRYFMRVQRGPSWTSVDILSTHYKDVSLIKSQ